MSLKDTISKRLPFVRNFYFWLRRGPLDQLSMLRAFCSDYARYRKYSYRYNGARKNKENLASVIMKYSHSVEKGFSMPEIRPGYGQAVIVELIKQLEVYDQCGFDKSDVSYKKATSVLNEYLKYHAEINFDLGPMREIILPWTSVSQAIGGYMNLERSELLEKSLGDFENCALSRCSVRSYGAEPVSQDLIREAVQIARKTPSACNRQCWNTYIVQTPELKTKVLALQNGNRGFGDRADFIAIITADMRSFVGAGERYGTYIDGGLYSMSFMYALHYKGIGACPLNWMVEPPADKKLRKLLNLSPSENVIMMISGGHIPAKVRIAKSVRKDVTEQLTFL